MLHCHHLQCVPGGTFEAIPQAPIIPHPIHTLTAECRIAHNGRDTGDYALLQTFVLGSGTFVELENGKNTENL